jgi:energy-converting hydrogenase Eha subunit A
MKEKFVMSTFFIGGMSDVATTAVGLANGFKEVGPLASHLMEVDNDTGAYITRIAVTSVMLGVYALSKEYPNRFSYSVDRAMRISNLITWGIVALNVVQIAQLHS